MSNIRMDVPKKTPIEEFRTAMWNRDWKLAYNTINSFPMYDMLRELNQLETYIFNEMRLNMPVYNIPGGPNMPRINYAMDTVQFRKLPFDVPPDVKSSNQVQDAIDFLAPFKLPQIKMLWSANTFPLQFVKFENHTPEQHNIIQQQRILMKTRFKELWVRYCGEWQTACNAAISTTPALPNPYEELNFTITLTTNITWGVVGILSPLLLTPVGPEYAALATVAIGALKAFSFTKSAPPEGRAIISRAIALTTMNMENLLDRSTGISVEPIISLYFDSVSETMAGDPAILSDEAKQNLFLYKYFAPDIPYPERIGILDTLARKQFIIWRAQFQNQFMAYKARPEVIAKAREYWHNDNEYKETYDSDGYPLSGSGETGIEFITREFSTPPDQYFTMVQDYIPFVPKFDSMI